ncbi:MAG: FtsX-like permease family protein [Streptosporangiales bacterium]|nr:FtsX-like permease family protein [Streptosporangiales bacterium]
MSRLLTVKLRRDLRATWPRLALMVVAITVSLTAFSAVLYAWSVIDREAQRAYLSTEPASATLRLGKGVDGEAMKAIAAEARGMPGVVEATRRTQFTSEVQVDGRPRDIQLQLYAAAPDDPMRMAKFFPGRGQWPPATGEVYVGRDSLPLLDLAVGDTVTVATPDGSPARLRVADTVYDPSLSPAAQEQRARGYLSAAALGRPDVFDQLKLQVADPGGATPSRDRDRIAAVASDVADRLQREHGVTVAEIQVPEPYAHPHQGQTDALLTALLIGAGASLLLAAILVATMLNGLFTQQIPQIGIMKAIGGGAGRIGRLYLAMTLVVAAAATVLALAPGILISTAFAPAILGFLGIDATSLTAAWWTYAVVAGTGVALPVSLTLVPLVRASRTTVRAAIDHRGTGATPRVATSALARLGRLDRGLLMSIRNTVRRPARTLLAVGLLAGAGMMFVAGMSTRDATAAVGDDAAEQLTWDVEVQLAKPTPPDEVTGRLERLPAVTRVEGLQVTAGSLAEPGEFPLTNTYPDQGHGRLSVTAVPSDTTMQTPPTLLQGRWLRPGETGAVVLNQVTVASSDLDVEVGDTVELNLADRGAATSWRVVGIAEELGANSRAYVTDTGLGAAMAQPPRSNTLRITTDRHDQKTRASAADAAEAALTDAGIAVRSAESVGRQETSTRGHLGPVLAILLATALPMGLIGCIGLGSTMAANVLERTREFAVMHAIGARPEAVRRIVVTEGVIIAMASCLLATVPAVGLTVALNALLGNLFVNAALPFQFSFLAAAIWTALAVLGAILATQAAATSAAQLTVREALVVA